MVNLSRADLTKADLGDANLAAAELTAAILTDAILPDAILPATNLYVARLSEADLTHTHWYNTIFANTDLSDAIGLDTCHHDGPSFMDYRTLRENPNLPLVFLRGVGLPDGLIDYLPSLLNNRSSFIHASSATR